MNPLNLWNTFALIGTDNLANIIAEQAADESMHEDRKRIKETAFHVLQTRVGWEQAHALVANRLAATAIKYPRSRKAKQAPVQTKVAVQVPVM